MKRKILIIIYIAFILFTLKLLYTYTANNILISKYNEGEYDIIRAENLTHINFPQSYIAYYNYGNILYQNGEYESAINKYELALNNIVPKDKRCSIRINYALAICKTVQVNEKEQESIKSAIKTYESAIEILTQEGCANKNNNNGHSLKAEQLKKDIQKEIDRLKKQQEQQNSDNNNDENDKNNEDNNNSQEKTDTIEEKIQNIKAEATKDQRDTESFYNNYRKEFSSHDKKNW